MIVKALPPRDRTDTGDAADEKVPEAAAAVEEISVEDTELTEMQQLLNRQKSHVISSSKIHIPYNLI